MPGIIFKCRYLKNASEHLNNFVEYVATREGVEKVPDTRGLLSATKKQQELIVDILQKIPDAADLFEYEDYLKNQTRENASEFITVALEQNIDLLGKRENYVGYIANRPGAEALGAHGLLTDANVPVVLSQVAKEVGSHSGNVWTNVVSLRREDAARLGYDNAKAWQDLICGQRNHIAQQMKIKPENLRWYAAFHNEGHHPHVHIIAYSVNPSEAYVTKEAINNMRGGFAKEIFKQDLLQIYSEQTKRRDILTGQSRDVMAEIIRQISTGICENKTIEELMTHLAERLKHTSGKKQYGYLKAPLKAVIDQIVDELAKDERVAECYEKWYEMRNEVLRTYADKLPPPLPLLQQKEFKSIKNMVITEAMNIGGHHFTFEPDEAAEASAEEMAESSKVLPAEEALTPVEEPATDTDADDPGSGPEPLWEEAPEDEETAEFHPHVEWSERYKEACAFLYGTDDLEPDFAEAYYLFMEEAETGNALAMHDLGRMHMDGLGIEMDAALAQEWYAKALDTFMKVEAEKSKPYPQYRIGKMHAAGLGTPQDYEAAAEWFEMAVAKNHKYAQYSLAGLYYQGRGVEQDFETAFDLYWKSARQVNPYASYELAKMLRDGIGTEKDLDEAEGHFQEAFAGFVKLEAASRDDKLQYRLGHMLYHGVGTEKDAAAAIVYFEKAARLGNVHAQYMLGKIYLDTGSGHENAEKALAWLTKAAGNGSSLAQYALGKLYRDGEHVEKDILKAVELFTQSAEQENQYAAYALGKLYLNGEDIPKDIGAAVKWLTASAEQGNQYAQYALGKLYLLGHDVPRDRDAAVKWLTASAAQGNVYAQFFLDHMGFVPRSLRFADSGHAAPAPFEPDLS
jgi:TPR repeat protein